jgi:hypothetical protein
LAASSSCGRKPIQTAIVRPCRSLQAELPSLECRRSPRCSSSCPDDRKGWKAGWTGPMTDLRHCRLAVTIGRLSSRRRRRGAARIVPANPGRHRGAPAVAAFPMLRTGTRLGLSGRQQERCVPDAGLRGQTLAHTVAVDQLARPLASSRCRMLTLVAILLSRRRPWPFIGGLPHKGDEP